MGVAGAEFSTDVTFSQWFCFLINACSSLRSLLCLEERNTDLQDKIHGNLGHFDAQNDVSVWKLQFRWKGYIPRITPIFRYCGKIVYSIHSQCDQYYTHSVGRCHASPRMLLLVVCAHTALWLVVCSHTALWLVFTIPRYVKFQRCSGVFKHIACRTGACVCVCVFHLYESESIVWHMYRFLVLFTLA